MRSGKGTNRLALPVPGAGAIITLRCREASSQREAVCANRTSDRPRLISPHPNTILVTN